MDSNEKAVFKTILYADIFSSPIAKKRLKNFLITPKKISSDHLEHAIQRLLKRQIINKSDDFLFLNQHTSRIEKRIPQKKVFEEKMKIAKKGIDILSRIETVLFVGLSGGLASGNAYEEDDIDFFIIAKDQRLWTTRLQSIFFLEINRLRRRRNEKGARDKICLNMFLSEKHLSFSLDRHDLYTAIEVAQMVPLFSRNTTYQDFLEQNKWITTYLSNFTPPSVLREEQSSASGGIMSSYPMIQLAKYVQRRFMRTHRTTEIVDDSFFAFHPHDYRQDILREYSQRLRKYKLT